MKRILAVVLVLIMVGVAFAGSDRIPSVTFWPGVKVALRSNVTTNDVFTYGVGDTNLTTNCTGYRYALVDVNLGTTTTGGTATQASLTPMFGDSSISKYLQGQATTVTASTRYVVEVDGEDEFTIKVGSIAGDAPMVNITVTPFNE